MCQFQGDLIMCLCFTAIFQSMQKKRRIRKKEKKNRDKNEILATHISEMAEAIFFKFGM